MLDRRELQPGVVASISPRLERRGYLVAFTERAAEPGAGPLEGFNLGLRSGDDPDRVIGNRRAICEALGISPFACAEQVHGARMARVGPKRAGAGFTDAAAAMPGADGLVTGSKGVPLAVLAADCVPIALVDPDNGVLVVVHAGWRGVAAGILGTAVQAFDDPAAVTVAVGPSIGPDHYEVGEDVAFAVSAAVEGGAVTRSKGDSIYMDLPGTVVQALKAEGIPARSIEKSGLCTACEPQRFFSYRRDGETGRQALIAARL